MTLAAETDTFAEGMYLESTLSDIDKVLSKMAAEEAAATTEVMVAAPKNGKEIAEETSEDKGFNFQNLVGQELSKTEKEEL
jgi:hypothetical protein